MDALELLTQRRSCAALKAPAPEGEALETILKAALRVPDHQALKPYEFILVKDEGIERLSVLFEKAAIASGQSPELVQRAPKLPRRAPLIIIVVAKAKKSVAADLFEQRLTAGCAVMAMQMAALAQGFSGIWRSGWPMFNRGLHESLDLGPDDQIVGFLYLGTPVTIPSPAPQADPKDFIRWL